MVASAGERRARMASKFLLQVRLIDLAHLEEPEHPLSLIVERREELLSGSQVAVARVA